MDEGLSVVSLHNYLACHSGNVDRTIEPIVLSARIVQRESRIDLRVRCGAAVASIRYRTSESELRQNTRRRLRGLKTAKTAIADENESVVPGVGQRQFEPDLVGAGLELVQRDGRAAPRAWSHHLKLCGHYWRGEFRAYEELFAASLEYFEDPVFRHDPEGAPISLFAHAGWNAWQLGRPDVARARLVEMSAAVIPANPQHLGLSWNYRASFHALAREYKAAEACASETLELCEKYHLPSVASTKCFPGYARAQLGATTDGIVQMRRAIDESVRIGHRLEVPFRMVLLAGAQSSVGAIEDGLETVERALTFNPEELVSRPEALRIRGELRLKQGHRELAEADFGDSIAMARSMGAKSWELRTTMSLARLFDGNGRHAEARMMLAEIYKWFTEGFATPDLKDARALLDELAA
jgi:tetratricopeptide (TPR) repeat protein